MHFWINKPAGRNYGFGGRRYPCSSSAPKTRSGQRGRRGREIGPMVTPVHRFQSLNGPPTGRSCYPGPSETTTRAQPQPQPQRQQQQQQHQQHQQQVTQQQQQLEAPSITGTEEDTSISASNFNQRRTCLLQGVPRNIVTSNNVTNAAAAAAAAAGGGGVGGVGNDGQITTNETTNSGLNRAGFLDFSEISDTELAGYKLRCGVWITFVVATGFVSVAKFYFGHRDAGLDMLIFCGLLFTLLLSGCFYSTLVRRAKYNHRRQERFEQEEQIATLAAALTVREDNTRGFQVIGQNAQSQGQQQLHLQLQLQQQQQQPPPPPPPPPPPYHIAILIPPPNSPEEAPPPSYDKAMNEDSSNEIRVFIFAKDEDNN